MPVIGTRGTASIKALGFAGAGKPLVPVIGTATRTSAAINVVFTPGYNGGAPITAYTAISTPGNYIFTGLTSPIVATGMTLGTNYTFTVYATNVYGDSPSSAISNSLKYASVPLTPTIGTATVTGLTSVNVTFTAPTANGGEPITSYTAVSSPGGVTGTINQAGSGTISVTGLTSGTPYTFKVYATNILGDGPLSLASNTVKPDLPTYAITSSVPSPINEGTSISFYVDTNELVVSTTIYWAITGTGLTAAELGLSSLTGSLAISPSSRATISLSVSNDGITEGNETLTLSFYTNSGRTTLLTGAAIGGYVTGNERTVIIADTSVTTYSIDPRVFSVNEGSSVIFDVSISGSQSATLYWNTQQISGTINSSDFTLTGSVSVSSGAGTITISPANDYALEGAESFRLRLYTDSGRTNLIAFSQTVTINDTSQYLPAGTYISQFCSGFNLYYTYADGSGGTYNSLVQTNSPTCGYVAPTLAPSVSINYNYTVPGLNSQTKAYYVYIVRGSEGATQSFSVSTGGLSVQSFGSGTSSGTLGGTAVIGFNGPHSATTVTVTVSKSGYTSYSRNFSVSANATYTPYTLSSGFTQESGISSGVASSVYSFYAGNGTYTVTNSTLNGGLRYQLYRAPEYSGFQFWCSYLIDNGLTTSSQQFLNDFGGSPESQTGPKTRYSPGTGWNQLSDRP